MVEVVVVNLIPMLGILASEEVAWTNKKEVSN